MLNVKHHHTQTTAACLFIFRQQPRRRPCSCLRAGKRTARTTTAAAPPVPTAADATFEEPEAVPAGLEIISSSSSIDDNADAALDDEARGRAGSSGISSGVRLENISVTFKNQQVLKDVSWSVQRGERVGLVGHNGAGKTTQLLTILGKIAPDGGSVVRARRRMRVAYLAQEFDLPDPQRSVREELNQSVFAAQRAALAERERLTQELEHAGGDMDRMQALLDRLDALSAAADAEGAEPALLDKRIDTALAELGFSPADGDRPIGSFSGGWQMRICLGKLLLQDPDVLLLDEPTNHLDLDAVEWLERYLTSSPTGVAGDVPMVIVSHDRAFLDAVATKIVETERGVATTYANCNYTAYVAARARREALQWAAHERQQKELARLEDMARRLAGGAQSGRAAAAEKQLERLRAEGSLVAKPFVAKRRPFAFPPVERVGAAVLSLLGVCHGYGGPGAPLLLRGIDLELGAGERIAIVGPNGAGKSTLLRLIMGREAPLRGTVSLGAHNVVPNYFEQNQAEALDASATVLGTLVAAAPNAKLHDLKQLLGRMQFSGAMMDKKVKVLSGGEKARLALAKFMCTKGTLLVLDEPTNHLDIPSKEALEEALRTFGGAVIAVSHDRYFLRRIATRVLALEGGVLVDIDAPTVAGDDADSSAASVAEAREARAATRAAKAAAGEKAGVRAKSKLTRAERDREKQKKAESSKRRAHTHTQTATATASAKGTESMNLLIVGAGGHGRVVAETAAATEDWNRITFLDDSSPLSPVLGFEVCGTFADAPKYRREFSHAVVAIGDARTRLNLLDKLQDWGFVLPVIVHPTAWVSPSATLGVGTVVFAQAAVNACVRVGRGAILNTGCSVDHGAVLGEGVHVCPGAHIAGDVAVGDATWLGIGCSVKQRVCIGAGVTVGASAAVVSDVIDGANTKQT